MATAMISLGRTLESQNKTQEAIKEYETARNLLIKINNPANISSLVLRIADCYKNIGQYGSAISNYSSLTNSANTNTVYFSLEGIGYSYASLANRMNKETNYQECIQYRKTALDLFERISLKPMQALSHLLLSQEYFTVRSNDAAFTHASSAVSFFTELRDAEGQAHAMQTLAQIYERRNEFERAAELFSHSGVLFVSLTNYFYAYYAFRSHAGMNMQIGNYHDARRGFTDALALARKTGYRELVSDALNSIGNMSDTLGEFTDAEKNYREALAIARTDARTNMMISRLNNLGLVCAKMQMYSNSIRYLQEGIYLAIETHDNEQLASIYNNFGYLYSLSGRNDDKAMMHYKMAVQLMLSNDVNESIGDYMCNIGTMHIKKGEYKYAMEYFTDALGIYKDVGYSNVAHVLSEIGICHYKQSNTSAAVDSFNRAIQNADELYRRTPDVSRASFLSTMAAYYRNLCAVYSYNGNGRMALDTAEKMKARAMADDMAKAAYSEVKIDLAKFASPIIYFINIEHEDQLLRLIITNERISTAVLSQGAVLKNIDRKLSNDVLSYYDSFIGKRTQMQDVNNSLAPFAVYYNSLIGNSADAQKAEVIRKLGKLLHDTLFAVLPAVSEKLENKIAVVPDGILGFIPFESLILPDGKYLIEKYDIKYAPSLTVLNYIENRQYSARNDILAFGGAVYKPGTYKRDMSLSDRFMKYLQSQTVISMNRGDDLSSKYRDIGFGGWKNLPFSLNEVKAISAIYPSSRIESGKSVNESLVKSLSKSGELAKYRIIHFATHGIAVPEIPELSAIVLSEPGKGDREDGYLTLKEISELKLNADLVVLSACETGLGKIYAGEGVVGLTQAFLIAGANGVIATLWQVNDIASMEFMKTFYTYVKNGVPYSTALTQTKRDFISGKAGGGKYKAPFYWAPFVYYGK